MERALLLLILLRGRAAALVLGLRGARVGVKAFVGRRCRIDRPWRLELGNRVVLESDVYLKLVDNSASLRMGDYVFLGRGVQFDVMESIRVGSHTVIAPRCFITDHNHGMAAGRRIDEQACRSEPTTIGADVWLGAGVVVLPGITIGDGAIVGANSVVTRDVAPMSVVAGCPARFVRRRTS